LNNAAYLLSCKLSPAEENINFNFFVQAEDRPVDDDEDEEDDFIVDEEGRPIKRDRVTCFLKPYSHSISSNGSPMLLAHWTHPMK